MTGTAMNPCDQLSMSLDDFVDMQSDQLKELKAGRVNKVYEWLELRQRAMARLRQRFAEVYESGVNEDLKNALLAKLGLIIDQENVINRTASCKKEEISEQINKIRKGKKALQGYGPNIMKRAPRFLSCKE